MGSSNQPYLGETVIYHHDGGYWGPRGDYAAIVSHVHAQLDESGRYFVDLAVITSNVQSPMQLYSNIEFGTKGGQYGWTDGAR